MCAFLPVLAVASIAATAASTGVAVASAKKGAKAEEEQALRNAAAAEQAAQDAERRGEEEAGKVRMQGTQLKAAQRVALATSGVELTSGSALETVAGTAALTELEEERARNNAWREAYGYRTQGLEFGRDAALARTRGNQQVVGTILGGAGAILQTGASFYRGGR